MGQHNHNLAWHGNTHHSAGLTHGLHSARPAMPARVTLICVPLFGSFDPRAAARLKDCETRLFSQSSSCTRQTTYATLLPFHDRQDPHHFLIILAGLAADAARRGLPAVRSPRRHCHTPPPRRQLQLACCPSRSPQSDTFVKSSWQLVENKSRY